jgi:hypothetical protein
MLRFAVLAAALVASIPASAQTMTASEARRFVVGKVFSFTCFEGTRGTGRVNADGSVAGTIQFRGDGPVRFASLPAGTLLTKGENVCASVKGIPFQPCFNLQKTDGRTFRGSISGLGFAYCDFKRRSPRLEVASRPLQLRSTVASGNGN